MQPMGRHPVKFPGKVDHHVKKHGLRNWWEGDCGNSEKKKTARRDARLAANDEAYEYLMERSA